jgi:septal ring factor EnvC (AmiA/AmiB activator)
MQPARNNPQPYGVARRDALARLSAIFVSASFVSVGAPATAQVALPAPQAAASPDAIKQREQELEATRAQQKSSTELQQQFKAEIAAIGQDRAKLNAQLIDVAAQVRTIESRIGDAETRLRPLDAREQEIRGSLDSRRAEVV